MEGYGYEKENDLWVQGGFLYGTSYGKECIGISADEISMGRAGGKDTDLSRQRLSDCGKYWGKAADYDWQRHQGGSDSV